MSKLVRHDAPTQHLRRAAKALLGLVVLCAVCGLPTAAKYPRAFAGEWAWLKYVGLGAALFALDIVIAGAGDLVRLRPRKHRGS